MTTDSSRTIRGRTGEEKRPTLILFRQLTDLLEIQHLTERHAPQRENILVEIIALRGGPALKGRRIAAHGAEIAVVQPILHGFFLLDARPLCFLVVRVAVAAECELRSFFDGARVEVLGPA